MRTRMRTTGPNLERAGAPPHTGKLPCPLPVHPGRWYSRGPERAHARAATRRPGIGGPGDRKELCIKTLYVRDRLCQQPLSCVRNASCRRAMLASTHSRCNVQGPGATRQGGCCRIVLSYIASRSPPPRAATTIVISLRRSVAGLCV